MIKQPVAATFPVYEGNVMALPLNWGTAGTMTPANVAKYVADLWPRAKSGVAYILDNQGAFEAAGLKQVEREVLLRCQDNVAEAQAMAAEGHEDLARIDKAKYKALMAPHWERVKKVDSQLRVDISPYVSPRSGLKGLMVRFSLPF